MHACTATHSCTLLVQLPLKVVQLLHAQLHPLQLCISSPASMHCCFNSTLTAASGLDYSACLLLNALFAQLFLQVGQPFMHIATPHSLCMGQPCVRALQSFASSTLSVDRAVPCVSAGEPGWSSTHCSHLGETSWRSLAPLVLGCFLSSRRAGMAPRPSLCGPSYWLCRSCSQVSREERLLIEVCI